MFLAGRRVLVGRRSAFPVLVRWRDALALVPRVAVIPHYDRFPEPMSALVALRCPRGIVVLGIDEDTAAVNRGESWQVLGSGRVTVWRGRRRERVRAGDSFRL
jgi:cyanophycinase-like exopeptidase